MGCWDCGRDERRRPLYAMENPFDLPGKALKNKRWLGEPVRSVSGRDVPLDVVLAGAPVE